VEITVAMECSDTNQLKIKKCESLVTHNYKEPVDGNFPDATADILRRINNGDQADCSSSSSETDMDIM